VFLALRDYYRATGKAWAAETAETGVNDLLARQIRNVRNPYRYGRWPRAYSTSGNGWIAEVLGEMASFLDTQGSTAAAAECRQAVRAAMQWVLRHAYTAENAAHLPDPQQAAGGLMWNTQHPWIRIDSVCHSLNALIEAADWQDFSDGPLSSSAVD
jgi:hypothetical protein